MALLKLWHFGAHLASLRNALRHLSKLVGNRGFSRTKTLILRSRVMTNVFEERDIFLHVRMWGLGTYS